MEKGQDKPLVWLHGEIKTPPFSDGARISAGLLLRRLQRGEELEMPHSRPMPNVGPRCHELRVIDGRISWRIVYHLTAEAVVILHVFAKKSRSTAPRLIDLYRRRLQAFRNATREKAR
jgi:phage-related protein